MKCFSHMYIRKYAVTSSSLEYINKKRRSLLELDNCCMPSLFYLMASYVEKTTTHKPS